MSVRSFEKNQNTNLEMLTVRLSIRAQNRFVSKSHPQLYRISLLNHGNASESICDATEVIRLKYYYFIPEF